MRLDIAPLISTVPYFPAALMIPVLLSLPVLAVFPDVLDRKGRTSLLLEVRAFSPDRRPIPVKTSIVVGSARSRARPSPWLRTPRPRPFPAVPRMESRGRGDSRPCSTHFAGSAASAIP